MHRLISQFCNWHLKKARKNYIMKRCVWLVSNSSSKGNLSPPPREKTRKTIQQRRGRTTGNTFRGHHYFQISVPARQMMSEFTTVIESCSEDLWRGKVDSLKSNLNRLRRLSLYSSLDCEGPQRQKKKKFFLACSIVIYSCVPSCWCYIMCTFDTIKCFSCTIYNP